MPIITLVVRNTANTTICSLQEAHSFDETVFKVSL